MIQSFRTFVEKHRLFDENDSLLLALSGGMDSMAMAELFHISGIDFAVAHCNFNLRGAESDADEAFVKEYAADHGVDIFSRSFNTEKIAANEGISIQMAARKLRYEYFEEIAREGGFTRIATAHHLDDQIETFFINLSRGCGIAGLHGIPVRNGKIIRPLMFAYRNDIRDFINENRIKYREDSSNSSLKYLRNRIRHELLPVFNDMNPSFRTEMTNTIHRLKGTEEVYNKVIEMARREVVSEDGDVIIDIARLKLFTPPVQFLYEIISDYGFKQTDAENIIQAMEGIPGKRFYSATHQLLIDREKIIISLLDTENTNDEIEINSDTEILSDPITLTFRVVDAAGFEIPEEKNIAALDHDKLHFPLRLRRWKQGDSFIPLGMKSHKKLSDFFIDEKFSMLDKERTWVLCSGDEIAWIIGHRIADPFKIDPSTKKIFLISSGSM